jgi:hypothetical protein
MNISDFAEGFSDEAFKNRKELYNNNSRSNFIERHCTENYIFNEILSEVYGVAAQYPEIGLYLIDPDEVSFYTVDGNGLIEFRKILNDRYNLLIARNDLTDAAKKNYVDCIRSDDNEIAADFLAEILLQFGYVPRSRRS